jgi:hypothetical protein
MQENPVTQILSRWPSRQAVLDDARDAAADLDMFAVHRWFQRGAVPSRYWGALIDGARRRGISVTLCDLGGAHDARSRRAS